VSPGNGGYSEDIAIKAAAKAYLGDPVPIEVVVQEELDADDRAVARVDRAFELIKEEREREYTNAEGKEEPQRSNGGRNVRRIQRLAIYQFR